MQTCPKHRNKHSKYHQSCFGNQNKLGALKGQLCNTFKKNVLIAKMLKFVIIGTPLKAVQAIGQGLCPDPCLKATI